MFINPFVSVDIHLENDGWIKQYEGIEGFTYAKNVGGGYIYIAQLKNTILGFTIRFYDPDFNNRASWVSEKELRLFARKMKEWKEQHGNRINK